MSATILGGDVTIYYLDENRQKRLKWTGAASTRYTANQLYSALADHFDESTQLDDGTAMSAQTPVEYTVGIIDTGDSEPWYVAYDLMEHIYGGAVRTSGWTRTPTTATGIVVVPVTAATNNIVTGDIGLDITHADLDAGTLLDIISDGGTLDYLVIRPDSSATANNFDSTSGNLTCNAHTAPQTAASTTGEQVWANAYSIGTIEPDTHIYAYQGTVSDGARSHVYAINDNTQDWWADGHIDICMPIRNFKASSNPIIDSGYISFFARKSTTEYAYFEAATSTTSGGRNPVPLGTKSDLNNTTGYSSITTSSITSDTYAVGDIIVGGTSGARAVITAISGTNPTYTFEYYLLGDPLTDFQTATETVNAESPGTGTGSKNGSAPTAAGPALNTWFTSNSFPTVSFTAQTFDVDDDGTTENYGIDIDCLNNPLTEVYEWLKYTTRRGETGTSNTDGIEGEQYVGAEVYIYYGTSAETGGTIAEGDDVTQETTGATGIVISHDTTNNVMLLRNTRGTFATGTATDHTITSNDSSGSVEMETADGALVAAFAANVVSPFGTFAGGTFFGARGVLLSNWVGGDENSFILTPLEGGSKQRPQSIALTVSNLVGTSEATNDDDRVAIFRLTGAGGTIDKTEFSAFGGETAGGATLDVDTAIPQDVPGKTTGGVVRMRDASDNNKEYRMRFSSWANTGGGGTDGRFTLANFASFVTTATTNTTQVTYATGGFSANVKRGDLVYNSTRTAVSYVASVDSDTQLTINPPITGQTTGDSVEINCIPIALVDTADDVFVPLLDKHATASEESVSIVYSSQIWYRVVVRNSANATTKILPFTANDTTSGTDRSTATIRSEDTIIS